MNKVFGYGEDALTYWALTKKLKDILSRLNDTSNPDECLVFYRPSFGRGGRSKALFGEFDAIVVSKMKVYLVESKWDRSSEVTTKHINLTDPQIDRHRILRWYAKTWDSNISWSNLLRDNSSEFEKEFPEKTIPPAKSNLASNIQYMLTKFRGENGLVDVLLLFCEDEAKFKDTKVNPENFKPVILPYEGLGDTNFFEM